MTRPDDPRSLGWLVLLVTLALSAKMGLTQIDRMNPDAMGYCRVAEYLAAGRFDLGVNAFWGPLLSWMILPGVFLGLPSMPLARLAFVVCAVLSVAGAWRVFGLLGLRGVLRLGLGLTAALHAAWWAGGPIAGDLPMVAALVWLFAGLLERDPASPARQDLACGALVTLAFWGKPAGGPFAIALVIATWVLRAALGESTWGHAAGRAFRAGLASALLLAPWVLALTTTYGEFTVTRSAGINHAMTGPGAKNRGYHPSFSHVHQPREGRVTTWEDPTEVSYDGIAWTPSSVELLHWQLQVARTSFDNIRRALRDLDGGWLGLVALLLVPLGALASPRARERWRQVWLVLPPALMTAMYLPFYAEPRYLYALWPVLLAALGVLGKQLASEEGAADAPAERQRVAGALLALVLVVPMAHAGWTRYQALLASPDGQLANIRTLAKIVRDHGEVGPVVSWAPNGNQAVLPTGTYLAWQLGVPWLGTMGNGAADLEQVRELGGRILLVRHYRGGQRAPAWVTEQAGGVLLGELAAWSGTFVGGHFQVFQLPAPAPPAPPPSPPAPPPDPPPPEAPDPDPPPAASPTPVTTTSGLQIREVRIEFLPAPTGPVTTSPAPSPEAQP